MTTLSQGAFDSSVIDELLSDKTIAFKSIYRDITGRTAASVMLSQLMYWTRQIDRDNPDRRGWFYKSAEELMLETGLSEDEIKGSKRKLKSLGILEMTTKGIPPVTWMRINKPALYQHLKEAIHRRKAAETERENRLKNQKRNGRISCSVRTEDVPDWILKTEDFRAPKQGGKKGQNQAAAQENQHRGEIPLYENRNFPSGRGEECPLLHTENTNKESKSVNSMRTREFSFESLDPDKTLKALYEMGMPKSESWYARQKISEFMDRFPSSTSTADCCRYVVKAIDHAWTLEGKTAVSTAE